MLKENPIGALKKFGVSEKSLKSVEQALLLSSDPLAAL